MMDNSDLDLNTIIPLLQKQQNQDAAAQSSQAALGLAGKIAAPNIYDAVTNQRTHINPNFDPNNPTKEKYGYTPGLADSMSAVGQDALSAIGPGKGAGFLGMAGGWHNFNPIRSTPELLNKLKDLIGKGKTYSQMANDLGITRSTIAGIMNREGLKGISGNPGGRPATFNSPLSSVPSNPNVTMPKVNMPPELPDISPAEMRDYLKIFGGQR